MKLFLAILGGLVAWFISFALLLSVFPTNGHNSSPIATILSIFIGVGVGKFINMEKETE